MANDIRNKNLDKCCDCVRHSVTYCSKKTLNLLLIFKRKTFYFRTKASIFFLKNKKRAPLLLLRRCMVLKNW